MSVPVSIATDTPNVDAAVPLFNASLGYASHRADYRHQYMVSPDGNQFLIASVVEGTTAPISVILNWKARP